MESLKSRTKRVTEDPRVEPGKIDFAICPARQSPAGKIYLGEQAIAPRVAALRRKRYASMPADIKVALTRPDPRPPADLLNNARPRARGGRGSNKFRRSNGFPCKRACMHRPVEKNRPRALPNRIWNWVAFGWSCRLPVSRTAIYNTQRGRCDKVENYERIGGL